MGKSKTINYIRFESLPSTNTWCKENASVLDAEKFTCVTAEEQTAGRGQFNRKWQSFKGLSIHATFHFCLPKQFSCFPNLAQLLSISTAKTLENIGLTPLIKWPNDLMLSSQGLDKKIGGILCELIQEKGTTHVILGIGLNVNLPQKLVDKIDCPATSLFIESQKEWSCDELLQTILHNFIKDLHVLETKGFASFHSYYTSHLISKGKQVLVKEGSSSINGLCLGITEEGKLLLELPCGTQKEICSGYVDLCEKNSI